MQSLIDFNGALSRFDGPPTTYSMPQVDKLLDQFGEAQYITTLDLTKGYWQILLTSDSQEKNTFTTPFCLCHFWTMPFSLRGAPATFQHLVDQVLQPHTSYVAAYLDDIVIYSQTWEEHLAQVEAVIQTLRQAELTANPAKCKIGKKETTYLGYSLGRGQV